MSGQPTSTAPTGSSTTPGPATLTAFLNANGKRALSNSAADRARAANNATATADADGMDALMGVGGGEGGGNGDAPLADEPEQAEGQEHKPGWFWNNARAKDEMARAMDSIVGKQFMIGSKFLPPKCCPRWLTIADRYGDVMDRANRPPPAATQSDEK
jgi:hypothetical protein